jgi:hypothetical protein
MKRWVSVTVTDHELALEMHDRAYKDMIQMRDLHGRNSPQYRDALADVRSAAQEIRPARLRTEQQRTATALAETQEPA